MFATVFGVDFSGARLAGRNTWVARLEPADRLRQPHFRLADLACLEKLAGTAERGPALAHLVELIVGSRDALWALDFPFGLPVEVMAAGAGWPDQFAFLAAWGEDAYGVGLECLVISALATPARAAGPHRTGTRHRQRAVRPRRHSPPPRRSNQGHPARTHPRRCSARAMVPSARADDLPRRLPPPRDHRS